MRRIGGVFIDPPPDVMRRLADKIAAKLLAEQAGVSVAAWSGGPVETVDTAVEHARTIGYPVVIKAWAGGGGRGIRFAASEEEPGPAFERARAEALRSFADATIVIERWTRRTPLPGTRIRTAPTTQRSWTSPPRISVTSTISSSRRMRREALRRDARPVPASSEPHCSLGQRHTDKVVTPAHR